MPPASKPGALAHAAGCSLPADLEGGSTTKAEGAAVRGDHLDPQCILVLEVRGVAGLAQRIQAGLLRTRGCRVEARQLEDHPGALVQLRQPEVHGRPFGSQLDLGTGSYVRSPDDGVVLAIAAENHRRLGRRCTEAAGSGSACTGTTSTRTSTSGRGGTCTRSGRCRSGSTCTRTAGTSAGTGTTDSQGRGKTQASDIALAHRRVPRGLDLTGLCVGCDAVVDAVVDENVGIGASAERTVLVADRRGLVGLAVAIVVGPPGVALHRREVHRLGVLEFHLLDGVVGADPEAGKQQVRECSGLAG